MIDSRSRSQRNQSKRWGQYFLKNKKAVQKIIEALDLKKGDVVIEIGSGKGALTIPLIKECQKSKCQIIAIEKDIRLVNEFINQNQRLKIDHLDLSALTKRNQFKIIAGDALKELPKVVDKLLIKHFPATQPNHTDHNFKEPTYKLVGNIPYYITGRLLRTVGNLKIKPKVSVLTIQKEVAERLSEKPPHMNLLSASTQIWADPSIIISLKPNDFSPSPKVDSAVIKLTTKPHPAKLDDYYNAVRAIFKQPRKTLLNNLLEALVNNNSNSSKKMQVKEKILKTLKKFGFNEKTRPQELSVNDIFSLSKLLKINS